MYVYIYIYIYIYIYRAGPPIIRYDVILSTGQVRRNVDAAAVRWELAPCEDVDIFMGGRWLPTTLGEKQSWGATTIGYRVNWEPRGIVPGIPASRLRRRFEPGERVYVYRGLEHGWGEV